MKDLEEVFNVLRRTKRLNLEKCASGVTHLIVVYLSVSEDAVSVVLVQEVNKEERSVYFVSRTLT